MAQATINARLNATVKERGDKVLRERDIDDGGNPRAVASMARTRRSS